MSKAVLNSSVIIALSTLGYLKKIKPLFSEILIAKAVYQEICSAGQGLIGARELEEGVTTNLIEVKGVTNQLLLNALLDPLALGELKQSFWL